MTASELARAVRFDGLMKEPDKAQPDKAERLEDERQSEREEGLTEARRGGPAAPSDRPENEPPHPQDVNEIGERL